MANVEGKRGKTMLWLMKSTLGILHAIRHIQALLVHNYHHDSHHCHCYRWCHPWILLAFKHFLTKFLCTNKQKLFHYTIVPILTVDLDEQISSEGILLFPARSTSFAQLVEGNNSGFNKLICVHDLVS